MIILRPHLAMRAYSLMTKLKTLSFFLSFTFSMAAQAYPNFIGYGYNSCMTCHYNPYGNGPLTDYGRALSATTISNRWIYPKNKTEEEIAKDSGFMYTKAFNKWWRPSIDYRGLRLIRDVDKDEKTYQTIHMQADFNSVFRLKGNDKYIVSISLGYAPTPKSGSANEKSNLRSREHYVGIRPNSKYGIYIGLMDKAFGIRIPDHIAFSRSVTGLAQNDQTHGVLFHFIKDKFEIGVHPFLGNIDQDSDLRHKGLSTKVEYNSSNRLKPGFSLLVSESDHIKHFLKSVHVKNGFSKGSSLLFELGHKTQEVVSSKQKTDSLYSLLQNHLLLDRGLLLLTTVEYLKSDLDKDSETMRYGPGIQLFPFQGVEIRFDLYNTKNFSSSSATKDTWDFGGQLHLWF